MKDFFTEEDFYATATRIGFDRNDNYARYACEIANRLLRERGRVVYCENGNAMASWTERDAFSTHTALLINVQEIEQDSLEKFARDFINAGPTDRKDVIAVPYELYERAKAILSKGE